MFSASCDNADRPSASDVPAQATVVGSHRTLAQTDLQTQRHDIDLVRIVASLLEALRPLLDASLRQSIRKADSLADLVTLANGDVVELTDHSDSIA